MDEKEFNEGKCHVIIDKTLFIFIPVTYKLFNTKKPESQYRYYLKERRERNEDVSDKIVDCNDVDDIDS